MAPTCYIRNRLRLLLSNAKGPWPLAFSIGATGPYTVRIVMHGNGPVAHYLIPVGAYGPYLSNVIMGRWPIITLSYIGAAPQYNSTLNPMRVGF